MIRRESQRRLLPRTQTALSQLTDALLELLPGLVIDCLSHDNDPPPHRFRPDAVPRNWLSVLDHWLRSGFDEKPPDYPRCEPGLITIKRIWETNVLNITSAAEVYDRYLTRDREILDPLIVGASDRWLDVVEFMKGVFEEECDENLNESDDSLTGATVQLAVSRLRVLVAVIGEQMPTFLQVPEEALKRYDLSLAGAQPGSHGVT
jgi:hypothetical protein